MKKLVVALTLILGVMLVVACASKPKPITAAEVDDELDKIYQKYHGDIILDDASTYTVKSGDTLSHIASNHYQDARYFPLIMLASSDVVKDPDKIQPGMELTLPDLQKNLDDSKSKAKIKSFLVDIANLQDRREGREADAKVLRELADTL
jgi:LysM repeat protein